MSGAIVIRTGRPGDAEALATVQCAAALAGYAHIFPADAPKPTPLALEPAWVALLADPAAMVLVAAAAPHGPVVGGVGLRPDGPGVTLLNRLYVHPDWWAVGVGGALLDAAVARAATVPGTDRLALWVLAGNDRARRWYERRGWTLVAGAVLVDDDAGLPEVRYERGAGPGHVS